MPRKNHTRRVRQGDKVRNVAMGEGMRELRKGSRAQPHRNRAREIKVTGHKEVWD